MISHIITQIKNQTYTSNFKIVGPFTFIDHIKYHLEILISRIKIYFVNGQLIYIEINLSSRYTDYGQGYTGLNEIKIKFDNEKSLHFINHKNMSDIVVELFARNNTIHLEKNNYIFKFN
jgi:hypothetical protein